MLVLGILAACHYSWFSGARVLADEEVWDRRLRCKLAIPDLPLIIFIERKQRDIWLVIVKASANARTAEQVTHGSLADAREAHKEEAGDKLDVMSLKARIHVFLQALERVYALADLTAVNLVGFIILHRTANNK